MKPGASPLEIQQAYRDLVRALIGEIQVHNRTGEDTVVLLTTKRARGFALRKATLAPQGDVTLGGLGVAGAHHGLSSAQRGRCIPR